MALAARRDEVPAQDVKMQGAEGSIISTKTVFGNDVSLMVASRPAGFHSSPHYHDSEQLNYVASGEMWIFIGDKGFLVKEGDFFRIPRNAIHWSWLRDKPCTLFEAHAPGIPKDPLIGPSAVGLYDEGESPQIVGDAINLFLDHPEASEVEARALAAANVEI